MAEYNSHQEKAMKTQSTSVETSDHGLFNFTKKEDEEKISSGFEDKSSEKEKKSMKEKMANDDMQDTEVPVEVVYWDKMPGHQGGDEVATIATVVEGEKGFPGKIRDKIPAFHSKTCKWEKETVKEGA